MNVINIIVFFLLLIKKTIFFFFFSQTSLTTMISSVKFTTIANHHNSGQNLSAPIVIKDQKEWAKFWTVHTNVVKPAPALPEVDFKSEMVIAVFTGVQNSGGYWNEIQKIEATDKDLIVYYESTKPEPMSLCTASLTTPHHIVRVPRTEKNVIFMTI
jgi:hypothetical protein